ncbi:MAG: 3-isopropylmalate dehydratase small subunit [Deltaproteobacteria bacterium]|nr:3-isopropylmalate dehydratase small subunit [Deltaproteobacteria bacterium]
MKDFGGPCILLDRNDINTDEIIPAKYLTENTKMALKPFLLEDLQLEGFDPQSEILQEAKVIISRQNFGCGSSREHAVWVLEVNGINVVIAENFARIFRQNAFNCGMLAIELSQMEIAAIFAIQPTNIAIDLEQQKISASGAGEYTCDFELNPFDKELVKAGGWLPYADKNY